MEKQKASGPLTLDLNYRNVRGTIEVVDSSSRGGVLLYSCEKSHRDPHLVINRVPSPAGPGYLVARVTFPHFSQDVDIATPRGNLELRKAGFFSKSHTVQGGQFQWTWEKAGYVTRSLHLVDDAAGGKELARFENSAFSMSSLGQLIVEDGWALPPEILDAVVATGLAKIEREIRRRRRAAAASAAAA